MVASILSIIVIGGWLLKRFLTKRDDPAAQYQREKDENAKIVNTGDADAVNRKLDDLTDRV